MRGRNSKEREIEKRQRGGFSSEREGKRVIEVRRRNGKRGV